MAARRSGLGRGLDSLIPSNSPVKKADEEKANSKSVAKKTLAKTASSAKEKTNDAKEPAKDVKKKTTDAKKAATAVKKKATTVKKKAEPAKKAEVVTKKAETSAKKAPAKVSEEDLKDKVLRVRLSKVEPDRDQARKNFDKAALQELSDSVSKYGVIQPILVRKLGDHYQIIAGERRWRAANMAGLKEIPVIVTDYDDAKRAEISIIENLQREDLNPIEEANAYARLIEDFELKQEEVAQRVSKSRAAVTNALRLLKLGEAVQQLVIKGELSEGHARTLLALPDEKAREDLANKIIKEKLSVRETERIIKMIMKPASPRKKNSGSDAEALIYRDIADQIRSILGTKVNISRKSKNKGMIEIEYYSEAEFERIVDLLRSVDRG